MVQSGVGDTIRLICRVSAIQSYERLVPLTLPQVVFGFFFLEFNLSSDLPFGTQGRSWTVVLPTTNGV